MARYREVRAEGFTFLFKYDPDEESLLLIFARHLTTVEDALGVWLDDGANEVWNDVYERFETTNRTHVLYWTWLQEGERVLIITGFERED